LQHQIIKMAKEIAEKPLTIQGHQASESLAQLKV